MMTDSDEQEVEKPKRRVKLYDDNGNRYYVESNVLQPGDNLTVADDQDDEDE